MKFKLGQSPTYDGTLVAAWGFDHNGDFIVNAFASPCGRFNVDPIDYGVATREAHALVDLNRERDLLAYT